MQKSRSHFYVVNLIKECVHMKNYLLTSIAANYKMQRMALEIAENLINDTRPLILIGIKNSGMVIAEKMQVLLKPYFNNLLLLQLHINKQNPTEISLPNTTNLNDTNIIIIDDVANSGRTMLYALKPLLDYKPNSIQTLVLVERMHKLFPIKPDYVGISIATTQQDHIQVEVENGEVLGAYLTNNKA